jgi:hypothetical protein
VAIISIAQQANPKVAGHEAGDLLHRGQQNPARQRFF